ncbi:SDR family NAD(P)-dependent oxidoreductase [Novosphingobium sp. JCM 18896]|uniref:SDR family NAD(P)-dependent oxidoreductase n=1 Tax=Novosphingobium sp. JCM 18896 TaxID=2989731 RepID=UPI0022219080|nr:SDR family oxidoreductase [Novosphingobium sp. JCM 18896]MCW1432516.1 SDR family oxidoreductase [Novosphingobium sp. JCM 18896]
MTKSAMHDFSESALADKVALVTGASQGIGFAIAKCFANQGACVFITGRRKSELETAVADIGPRAHAIVADAASLTDLDRVMETVKAAAGRLDVLVANAGTGEIARLCDITEQSYDATFGLNVKGVVFTVQKALPLLSNNASVILVGSSASTRAMPSQSLYGATKAALRSLARSWMLELRHRNIRVNVLSPGPVETRSLMSMAAPGEEAALLARIAKVVPMGRVGQCEEIACSALYLATSASSFVNGTELFVDGGHGQV